MNRVIYSCWAGHVVRPDPPLLDRQDGGNLWVEPARPVWDRTDLEPKELIGWQLLVAATAQAMLEGLPQLDGGCLNYWDAGNWSLHPSAEPVGPKRGTDHRGLHLHLMGRSRTAVSPAWTFGEAPLFPRWSEREQAARAYEALTVGECGRIVRRLTKVLQETLSPFPRIGSAPGRRASAVHFQCPATSPMNAHVSARWLRAPTPRRGHSGLSLTSDPASIIEVRDTEKDRAKPVRRSLRQSSSAFKELQSSRAILVPFLEDRVLFEGHRAKASPAKASPPPSHS